MRLCALILSLFCFNLTATTINVTYIDEPGVGFNSTEPYVPTAENPATTLGEARRHVLERTVRMFSTQFYSEAPIFWGVKMDELGGGFGAITLGPVFSEFTLGNTTDQYGILKVGTHYPRLLMAALTSNSSRNNHSGYDAETEFASFYENYSFIENNRFRFASVVLHELVHVIGFATTDCLRDCFPQPRSRDSHYNEYVYVEGQYNKTWQELALSDKEEAAMLEDILYFKGSQATLSFAANNLFSGVSENGIGLHSGTNSDGTWDGQSIRHLSPNIAPAQLMHSAGADVLELGAAAYILCDIGWCRNDGFVADLSLSSSTEASIKPNSESILSVEVANLSSKTVNNVYLQFTVPQGMHVNEQASSSGCEFIDGDMICNIPELLPEQHIDIEFAVTAVEGVHVVDSKLYSKSFIVDPKGINNLNVLKVTSEELPFPTIAVDDSYTFSSGDSAIITPKYSVEEDDTLSFSWKIVSGFQLLFEFDSSSGVMNFTAPEVTGSQTTNFLLTITSKGRTQEQEVTVYTVPKHTEPDIVIESSSSGGSISVYLLLLTLLIKCRRSSGGMDW